MNPQKQNQFINGKEPVLKVIKPERLGSPAHEIEAIIGRSNKEFIKLKPPVFEPELVSLRNPGIAWLTGMFKTL